MRAARADLPLGPEKYNEKPHRGHQERQNNREGGETENWHKNSPNPNTTQQYKNIFQVTMLSNLKWSDTDNFYMNLGCHKVTFLCSCNLDL